MWLNFIKLTPELLGGHCMDTDLYHLTFKEDCLDMCNTKAIDIDIENVDVNPTWRL